MKILFSRLCGFIFLPLIGLVTPLLFLPLIAREAGTEGWASMGAAQALGGFAGIFILWGWGDEGPVLVATNPNPQFRSALYRSSLESRLLAMLVVFPLVSLFAALLASADHRWDALTMSWTTVLAGLSPAWYCVGIGKPLLLILYETLPRVGATLLCVPVLLLTHQIWIYGVLTLLMVCSSLAVFQRREILVSPRRASARRHELVRRAGRIWYRQRHLASSAILGSLFAAAPLPIAQLSLPSEAAAGLASTDVLYRLGVYAIAALLNAMKNWVLDHTMTFPRRRQLFALSLHLVLALCGGLMFPLFGPWAEKIFLSGVSNASTMTYCWYGLAYFMLALAAPIRSNLLIPAHKQRWIFWATVASLVFGLSFMLLAGLVQSPEGIACGLALGETIPLCVFLFPAWAALRQLPKVQTARSP